jgi:parvulin-like peptidyl-prolyl isomerase
MARNPNQPLSPTKKHLARQQREQRQTRIIIIISVVVAVLVVGVLGYGILYQSVLKWTQPVAVVNGENVTANQFIGTARWARYQLIRQAEQSAQFIQILGNSPEGRNQVYSQLQQINAQLDPTEVGKQSIDKAVQDIMVRQEAKKRGIQVSSAEVDKTFQDAFGYYPGGTPTVRPTIAAKPTSTLSSLQMTLIPPTATTVPTPTPAITATGTVTATKAADGSTPAVTTGTPTSTKSAPVTPTATQVLTPTATAAPTLTPTPYTQEGFNKVKADTLASLQKDYFLTEADIRAFFEFNLYQEKLAEDVNKDAKPVQEQYRFRQITVTDDVGAKDVQDRLNKGEDFCKIASQVSLDLDTKTRCGDTDWKQKSQVDPAIASAAANLKVGEISQPIKTATGVAIVQLIGHEDRPLTDSEFQAAKQQAFQDFLSKLKEQSKIELKAYADFTPKEPVLPPAIQQILDAGPAQGTTNPGGSGFPTQP